MTHLTLTNISKFFGDFTAVRDFNLEVNKGEFVSFLGPSGCGKTTTLRMIAGFEIPSTGTISIEDEDITDKAPNARNVGMVFQAYALFPNMTVAQNIGFGLQVRKQPKNDIRERVNEMLSIIHMEEKANSYPYQLSGGQMQRVALARALAIRPEVLLLDEPLSALDAKIRVSLRAEIRSIQQKLGITAIYVTHDQEEALSLSDRIVVMNAGEMEQVGTPFEVYNYPTTRFVANFVGSLNTAEAEIVDVGRGTINMNGVVLVSSNDLKGKSKGGKVTVAIRPERLSFLSEGKKENTFDAKVENITFLGSVVRVEVLIGGRKFSMDTFNRPSLTLPNIGDACQVTCSDKAVLILKE